jgi:hypothetical protein
MIVEENLFHWQQLLYIPTLCYVRSNFTIGKFENGLPESFVTNLRFNGLMPGKLRTLCQMLPLFPHLEEIVVPYKYYENHDLYEKNGCLQYLENCRSTLQLLDISEGIQHHHEFAKLANFSRLRAVTVSIRSLLNADILRHHNDFNMYQANDDSTEYAWSSHLYDCFSDSIEEIAFAECPPSRLDRSVSLMAMMGFAKVPVLLFPKLRRIIYRTSKRGLLIAQRNQLKKAYAQRDVVFSCVSERKRFM